MITIKNWSSLQSYKDRIPPWIRLHRSILDNYKFHKMGANARALLPMLWLLASEDSDPVSGTIRIGYEEVTFRLRMDLTEFECAIKEISEAGFIDISQPCNESVTKPLQNRTQTVTPETETETETETEICQKPKEKYFETFWQKFPNQRKGNRDKAFSAWKQSITRAEPEAILRGLEAYLGSDEVAGGFAKGAAAWLNDDRWASDYKPPKQQGMKKYSVEPVMAGVGVL